MKNIQLQITPAKARQMYRTASPELKTILEESAPEGFSFSYDPCDIINSYEDACAYNGNVPMDEAAMLRAGFRQDEIDRRKCEEITLAYNDGKYIDWTDPEQYKYIPWLKIDPSAPSGFAFHVTDWCDAIAHAGDASRLCFLSEKHARDAGQKFTALYGRTINNRPTE